MQNNNFISAPAFVAIIAEYNKALQTFVPAVLDSYDNVKEALQAYDALVGVIDSKNAKTFAGIAKARKARNTALVAEYVNTLEYVEIFKFDASMKAYDTISFAEAGERPAPVCIGTDSKGKKRYRDMYALAVKELLNK